MKNTFILFLILLLSSPLTAQEEKPDLSFIVGGSFNFNFSKNNNLNNFNSQLVSDNIKFTSFNFAPFIGKEVTENWLLGVNLIYGSRSWELEVDESKFSTTDIGIGLMGRYYFTPANKFSFFAQPSVFFNSSSSKNEDNGNTFGERTTTTITGGVAAGARYRLTKKLYITIRFGGLSYSTGKTKFDDQDFEQDFNSFDFNLRLSSIFFGVELQLK